MLEAIRERSKSWLAKLILAAVTIPFAIVGIDTYLRDAGSSVSIAKVDGESISVQEYNNSMQRLRNQLQAEGKTDPSVLEQPDVKQSILDRLIINRLLNNAVTKSHFAIGDAALSDHIITLPEFQENGKFSQETYDRLLTSNRLTPSQFESTMRTDLLVQQAREGLAALAYLPEPISKQTLATEHQQREVTIAEIKTADFLDQVKVDEAQIKAYYDQHKDKFKVPEQVKLEFVLFSSNNLIPKVQVSDEEVKKYYDENAAKFQGNEQRRASHILISFGVSATAEAKQQAKKQAEEVLAQVRQHPDQFADLAKKYSKDPGSAEKGGDLGSFGRGMMVKPFEDAVFSMKPGEISNLVESEFGYHIIKLTEITGQSQGFDAAKPQIKAELLYQKAIALFAEQAESFNNMVYEQSTSLKPVADAFGLQVQHTDWISHADGAKYFKSDKLMNMVFAEEVLKDKRNTEAVEVSPNNLISARVVDYKPAAPRSYEEVKAGIEGVLKAEQAAKLAIKKGEAALADLRQGKSPQLDWIPPVTIDRSNAQGLTDVAMNNAFKIDVSKLPAYAGVADSNKGYLLIKVNGVNTPPANEDTDKASARELQAALASEYVAAYVKSLKDKSKITVNSRLLLSSGTGDQ
ncbi:SurA N-terminal domain-containing protein [Methylovorus sp. MP688]|uniref:SurA N-terminal domain-containing protein n=1 Tax=Methylovorus sp. (strain MP688) TaxID=887061 RepID=UPI0001EC47A8|nr:SurA N-terminal domain-containing protein [Methylovorus sp. MP688]ADQ84690.1 PpiC-type peptidyl-prolyl cis-trans isomerase [Methylovorus sp. MP688]